MLEEHIENLNKMTEKIKQFLSFMVVLNEVHGKLPHILDDLPADTVTDVGLLEQDITAVFFIGQDAADR